MTDQSSKKSTSTTAAATATTSASASSAAEKSEKSEKNQDLRASSLTSLLIEMILNHEASKRKSSSSSSANNEPLERKVAKFIKVNQKIAQPSEYLNRVDTVCSHGVEVDRPLTPLMAACMINDVEVVYLLLKNGARLTDKPSSYGFELAYAILRPKNLSTRQRKNRNELINLIINMMENDPNVKS